MTTPTRVRKIEDVDRDINQARQERGRTLVQIEQYLSTISTLRAKYARAGVRIDGYLEERTAMAAATQPDNKP